MFDLLVLIRVFSLLTLSEPSHWKGLGTRFATQHDLRRNTLHFYSLKHQHFPP